MIKLQTGISTNMDFIKAMKERGQDVKAEFPAETLRKQLDELSEETKVTFESTNETVLKAVNEGDEPTPVEEVVVTINVDGLDEGDSARGTIGDEAIVEFPAEITREKGTTETLEVTCEGYNTETSEVTFDEDKTVNVTLEKEPKPEPEKFDVIFNSCLDDDGFASLCVANEGISFPDTFWEFIEEEDRENTHYLKENSGVSITLDNEYVLQAVRYYEDTDAFGFLVDGNIAQLFDKYGKNLEGCPVSIIAPEGLFELNGTISNEININEKFMVEHLPLWTVE